MKGQGVVIYTSSVEVFMTDIKICDWDQDF